jgi:hypothetical protein
MKPVIISATPKIWWRGLERWKGVRVMDRGSAKNSGGSFPAGVTSLRTEQGLSGAGGGAHQRVQRILQHGRGGRWDTFDTKRTADKKEPNNCYGPDANRPNQIRFGSKMHQVVGDALSSLVFKALWLLEMWRLLGWWGLPSA